MLVHRSVPVALLQLPSFPGSFIKIYLLKKKKHNKLDIRCLCLLHLTLLSLPWTRPCRGGIFAPSPLPSSPPFTASERCFPQGSLEQYPQSIIIEDIEDLNSGWANLKKTWWKSVKSEIFSNFRLIKKWSLQTTCDSYTRQKWSLQTINPPKHIENVHFQRK